MFKFNENVCYFISNDYFKDYHIEGSDLKFIQRDNLTDDIKNYLKSINIFDKVQCCFIFDKKYYLVENNINYIFNNCFKLKEDENYDFYCDNEKIIIFVVKNKLNKDVDIKCRCEEKFKDIVEFAKQIAFQDENNYLTYYSKDNYDYLLATMRLWSVEARYLFFNIQDGISLEDVIKMNGGI